VDGGEELGRWEDSDGGVVRVDADAHQLVGVAGSALYKARRGGVAECTIINSVTFSGVSKPTNRFMRSSTGTAGQLHSCMMRNASSKRVPVVTVGISRRMTSPTRKLGSFLRKAAIRS